MAQYDEKTLYDLEERLAALEALCLTEEEREINRLMFKIVRSIKLTLWLTNGAVKYFAGPIAVAVVIWTFGETVFDWIASKLSGIPK